MRVCAVICPSCQLTSSTWARIPWVRLPTRRSRRAWIDAEGGPQPPFCVAPFGWNVSGRSLLRGQDGDDSLTHRSGTSSQGDVGAACAGGRAVKSQYTFRVAEREGCNDAEPTDRYCSIWPAVNLCWSDISFYARSLSDIVAGSPGRRDRGRRSHCRPGSDNHELVRSPTAKATAVSGLGLIAVEGHLTG